MVCKSDNVELIVYKGNSGKGTNKVLNVFSREVQIELTNAIKNSNVPFYPGVYTIINAGLYSVYGIYSNDITDIYGIVMDIWFNLNPDESNLDYLYHAGVDYLNDLYL